MEEYVIKNKKVRNTEIFVQQLKFITIKEITIKL
jgi:hypothetical protein